ncbi:MAG: hypothetical protein AAGK78_11840 [Planctomycetota bacterium]
MPVLPDDTDAAIRELKKLYPHPRVDPKNLIGGPVNIELLRKATIAHFIDELEQRRKPNRSTT